MTATETLKREHQIILMVLEVAANEAHLIKKKGEIHSDILEKLVEFFQNFADRCHHAREERFLYERMRLRGVPVENGPIGVMLMEHDEGRDYVLAIAKVIPQAENNDPQAVLEVAEYLLDYVEMKRVHIDREDNIFYPMADRVLTSQDQQELAEAFKKIETEEIGSGAYEKYHQLARELVG